MQKSILLSVLLVAACGSSYEPLPVSQGRGPAPFDPDQTYSPLVSAADLSPNITNPFLPFPVGASFVYQAKLQDGGTERIEITVETQTRSVNGFEARVVRDTVTEDGELLEDTWDWYGQDSAGHVWYVGEDTAEYENGRFKCNCGAWEWGKDVDNKGQTALPGVIMLANPQPGDVYRQEYYPGAEDLAQVVERDVSVMVPAGSFSGCLKTNERAAHDLSYSAFKTYCPGVGLVLEEEDGERVELIQYPGL
jgi:hypothetical protein